MFIWIWFALYFIRKDLIGDMTEKIKQWLEKSKASYSLQCMVYCDIMLCFVVTILSIPDSCNLFSHNPRSCFTGTGTIIRLAREET